MDTFQKWANAVLTVSATLAIFIAGMYAFMQSYTTYTCVSQGGLGAVVVPLKLIGCEVELFGERQVVPADQLADILAAEQMTEDSCLTIWKFPNTYVAYDAEADKWQVYCGILVNGTEFALPIEQVGDFVGPLWR